MTRFWFDRAFLGVLGATASLGLTGCNLNKMVANQTASVMSEAAPALDGFWDYEIAGKGIPSALLQLEAMHSISPDNADLALNLAKAYVGYGVGWVENEYELAEAEGDLDRSDKLRHRARLLYLRARDLALKVMRNRDAGIDKALKDGAEALAAYLKNHYTSKDDVAPVFWAGMAWGAALNMSLDEPELIADMPVIRTLVERAMELDDLYYAGGAYIFLGSLNASLPPAFGGDPEKGREIFEKGLERTKRRNHMLLFHYARTYAVSAQNRELYHKLLMEIIEAPDQGNDVRLTNKVARVRAERYLAQEADKFPF